MSDQPGPEPGDPILGAVDEAFEPRRPTFSPPPRTSADPPRPPVPLRPRLAAAGGARSGAGPLAGSARRERRARLERVAARGLPAGELEWVVSVLGSDPDPEARALAARALASAGPRGPLPILARALTDPSDRVRAEAVAGVSAHGREALRLVTPALTDRRWPMAQAAALRALPDVLRQVGRMETREIDALLVAVASLDPPPLAGERAGLAAAAQVVGLDPLVQAVTGRDIRRLGGARLLALTDIPGAARALAGRRDDPLPEIRQLARAAEMALHLGREAGEPGASPGASGDRTTVVASTGLPPRQAPPEGAAGQAPFAVEPALIASLARALADPGEVVRAQARAALGRVRKDVVAAWVTHTLDQGAPDEADAAALVAAEMGVGSAAPGLLRRAAALSPEVRGAYLTALEAIRVEPTILIRLVSEVEPSHRQAAVRLAWQVGGQELLPHLSTLLDDSAGAVRMAVLQVLADSGHPDAMSVAHERLLADSSAAVRATAVQALARSGAETRVAALTQALSDPDPDVRATAVEALPNGEGMASLLIPAFRDQDERVWRAAVGHLAALPPEEAHAIWLALREAPPFKREELLRAIEEGDPIRLLDLARANARASAPEDRALAVELAARSGTIAGSEVVVAALEDPDHLVRWTAAVAMARLRPAPAVPALARALADPQVEVRVEAVRALGVIDDDTVPGILVGALNDPEVRVREMATEALTRWHSPAVARRLAAALASPDLRRAAGEVLERMGGMAAEALSEVAAGPDADAARAAGRLLERLVGPQAFVEHLGSIEPELRLRAVGVLAAIGGPQAAEALIRALADPDVRVRSLAAEALGAFGYLRAIRALRRMFLTDPVADAAAAAERALRRLGAVPADSEPTASPEASEETGAWSPET